MKTILALGFLLLASEQVSAQTLPFYDLSYYDSPECAKVQASQLLTGKGARATEATGKVFCAAMKRTEMDSRPEMQKPWNAAPASVRFKCITELANARKNGRLDAETYVALEACISERAGK
jgi:hypothetical protein